MQWFPDFRLTTARLRGKSFAVYGNIRESKSCANRWFVLWCREELSFVHRRSRHCHQRKHRNHCINSFNYCIPAMLRRGINAHALILTLGHGVNLRFVRHVTTRALSAETEGPWLLITFFGSRPSVLSLFWALCILSSAGLLNVANISKCCERAILSYRRRKCRRSVPIIWLSKIEMDDAVASATVCWKQSKSTVYHFVLEGMSHPPWTKRTFTWWPRVEISAWAFIPRLNIAGIQ